MPRDSDFKIKGAAERRASDADSASSTRASEHHDQPDQTAATTVDDVESEAEKVASEQDAVEEGEVTESTNELLARYRYYQCPLDDSESVYYIHCDTQASQWEEPDEPYWIFDKVNQSANLELGLQYPREKPSRVEALGLDKTEEDPANAPSTAPTQPYTGYIPAIHGNYDPNADYAKYHDNLRVQEAAATAAADTSTKPYGMTGSSYESTMALNRRTGNVQSTGIGPERHSDHAKSGRQMDAFFNVDDAANSHEGRSLKEERRAQNLSKKQVEAYKKARQEKKTKKRMAWLKS